MFICKHFNPDKIFKKFKIIEFPVSYVGLSTTQQLDVEVNLETCAYFKTMYDGNIMKFEDAREVSPSHRAFIIKYINDTTIEITFTPKTECISKAKSCKKHLDKRFVFDLRLIQASGKHCCNNECHAEIGRYYISGQYEYCGITHSPNKVQFGDVIINSKVSRTIRLRNNSNCIAAKIQYVRVPGFEVTPQKLTIPPNSMRKLDFTIKPTCLKLANTLIFRIMNPHDQAGYSSDVTKPENFIIYKITTQFNIIYDKAPQQKAIESLHKLYEQCPTYTYLDEELTVQIKRKKLAVTFLEISKSSFGKQSIKKSNCNKNLIRCYSDTSILNHQPAPKNFCDVITPKITIFDLFDVEFTPSVMDFGRVGLNTYGEQNLSIKNNTKYDITINLCQDNCILYTEIKKNEHSIKLKASTNIILKVFCQGFIEGSYDGTFDYHIDNIYEKKYSYTLQVGTPTIMLKEKSLKFGMTSAESFITSVPIRIYNYFNIPVEFSFEDAVPDTPFEIIPSSGTIFGHTCKICDVLYNCKPTKTKTHEVDLISRSRIDKIIPIELNIITRKLSIKFLQQAVVFKDVPLNLEVAEKVKLENSSREIALFHVVEPLIPGIRVEPMSGMIRPKMILTFMIIVKISCVLEFVFDIYVKINNKENVILPISGNVIEPKIIIHPKHINMARIPCFMTTFAPVTFQNLSVLKTVVEVLDTGDDNIFDVYVPQGNEKRRVLEFTIEGGQTKTVFIKIYDIFRREYDMFIPFKINKLLGPPDNNSWTMDMKHYIGEYEKFYENNPKVKLKHINKDISYCRLTGVITVPWIQFSIDKFEIEYKSNGNNSIHFTMTNVSKYFLHVTIIIAKLLPNFSLQLQSEHEYSIVNENMIRFDMKRSVTAELCLNFHPKGHGRFASVATLFLDKQMTLPYNNLTFIGKRQTPELIPSCYSIIFPPCHVETEVSRTLTLKLFAESSLELFNCISKEEKCVIVDLITAEVFNEESESYTIVTVDIKAKSGIAYARNLILNFYHECGSGCDIEVNFCFTYCPLTLHTSILVSPTDNPYPFYPLREQTDLYVYLENCLFFLEKWMYQQGFRRDLYPEIPETFLAISTALSSQTSGKTKGINVNYLNFVRRIAGPLMKHIRKITVQGVDESFKFVKEIHDTYKEIILLLRSRGANLWALQARFLLSYDQFVIYCENVAPKCNADIILSQSLLGDEALFYRLSKQSWIDFILQSYKVFVMDSCFFECVCVSSQPKNIIKVIMDWYNEQIKIAHNKLRGKEKPVKVVKNITTDLTDGIAVASVIINHCPFMEDHFSIFCNIGEDITEEAKKGNVIHNASLIIEAMNHLRLYFPFSSTEFLHPNFIQMLFLSVHLYVALPMYRPKDTIVLNPPLLRSSTRLVAITPTTQESLIFNFMIFNNTKNSFLVEKAPSGENGKKMYLQVKFEAKFVKPEKAILIVHGYNKTRIFDTYIVFLLNGNVGALNPIRKCKVTGPLYRPNKADVLVASPFPVTALFKISLTDVEPVIPVVFEDNDKPCFLVRRLNLMEKEILLSGIPKETGQDLQEHKLFMQMICLSTQISNSWIWFRSEIGEFFIRVTTQARWDLAIDTLQASVTTWPMDPCSCGEACECYRTTVIMIPHRNELMVRSLRHALLENASDIMMQVFDSLIDTLTGKIALSMLLAEGGTNMSDVNHILRSQTTFRISSRSLLPCIDRVTLSHHTAEVLPLPLTLPADDKSEKYTLTFTSECGMDIRTYRIIFVQKDENEAKSG